MDDKNLPLHSTLTGEIDALCRRYNFVTKIQAGKSVLGKEIFALKIGELAGAVLYAGAFHAQEWITAMLLMRFTAELCTGLDRGVTLADIDCRKALLGRGLVIIPCVNPDGVEIALRGVSGGGDLAGEVDRISGGDLRGWNANARGVDINHNFDAGWHIAQGLEAGMGITGSAPRRYGGLAPESEPETRALCDFCRANRFRMAVAWHAQGEEIFWKYGDNHPPKSALIANLFAISSGYRLAAPDAIASHAGFKDWFIGNFRRPAYTVEIGKGENPLPVSDLEGIYAKLLEMMMIGIVV